MTIIAGSGAKAPQPNRCGEGASSSRARARAPGERREAPRVLRRRPRASSPRPWSLPPPGQAHHASERSGQGARSSATICPVNANTAQPTVARWTAAAAVVIAGCSGSGSGADAGADSANLPACAQSLSDYCAEAGALCPMTWDSAQCALETPECAGGFYLYACDGLDVASCPGDEGGGHTLVFDPSSHALVAVVEYPSLVGGGSRGCYVGPESLRSTLQSGPPNCPTGPLLGGPAADGGGLIAGGSGMCL